MGQAGVAVQVGVGAVVSGEEAVEGCDKVTGQGNQEDLPFGEDRVHSVPSSPTES